MQASSYIWHADVEDKPIVDIAAERKEESERLDKALLRRCDINDGISLSGCRLIGADVADADIRSADLTDATLIDVKFVGILTGANLFNTDFNDAIL